MHLNVVNLGRCEYEKALQVQIELLEKRQRGEIEDTLILVEHPPVITKGRHADETNIIGSEASLINHGIQLFNTDRGGDVTYHGPGQIVGYPIVNIRKSKIGVKKFVENLEEVLIRLLDEKYHITATRSSVNPGVWVGANKIAAIGLAVKRGVSMHGFALNVSTNLAHFKFLVPCGIADRGVTSIEEILGYPVDFHVANQHVLAYFSEVFNYDIIETVE
ncbi:lipoyl(octanoyl) transferase LipB [Alkaliphilus metalliredigens]|uniref:Octanoyltransferase n=1 Tax=Alkaliphilus metalliredigens (strain QYMF) TaxID=293826 RepID=LIPB_ALKMQ|nr:lipoyl(octanoyl) transferase LipB [Alkaliphilus metalliredigens]A6TWD0.2 RecName: Full=Octanoyltransferase; AltName: Full=Lipoate-protein ligase B; AltName: Full=Lipoyl/octanoyl transferase; AltName: Full=Octanoyl-[acyl-carrier-protein]-protein N-octanoyltransferase [Alkaliphilus metalliredigens QYMF]